MPKYVIYYSVDGGGRTEPIEADSEREALEKFENGKWTPNPIKMDYDYEAHYIQTDC